MAEVAEDFPIHRFIQELFEDLALTLPALGCRFDGCVTASALTVSGGPLALKNQLFLLFADLATGTPTLQVKFRPALHDQRLVLGFFCTPFDQARLITLPTWDPDLYTTFSAHEGQGFSFELPLGAPIEAGPPVSWHQLAQLYGGANHGRQVLDHFLERSKTLVPQLGSAISCADGPEILRLSHTLKGSARGVTAQALAESALQLEMVGRSGDLTGAADLYKALLVTYDEFIRWVREGQQ